MNTTQERMSLGKKLPILKDEKTNLISVSAVTLKKVAEEEQKSCRNQ